MEFCHKLFLTVLGVIVLFTSFAISNAQKQDNDFVICHVTGSETNPFEAIPIAGSALNAHLQHGDVYPVPAAGCPSGGAGPSPVPTATPEPMTILLFGSGLAGLGYAARRVRRKKLEDRDGSSS